MKRYISSATKNVKGQQVQYTSIKELDNLLDELFKESIEGYNAGEEVRRIPLEFVAGPVELVLYCPYSGHMRNCNYKIFFNGEILLDGYQVSRLQQKGSKDYITYDVASKAMPKNLDAGKISSNVEKKRMAARVRENKKLSSEDIAYEIYHPNVSSRDAEDAISRLRRSLKDEDWESLNWTLTVIDSKTESWASIYVQGYGYTTTTTYKLTTNYNTYTTSLSSTEGWHTE